MPGSSMGPGGPPPPSSAGAGSGNSSGGGGGGSAAGGSSGPTAPSAQPLPSNVLGKSDGSGSMDQQYMQTSSQIFVFSTQWANRSAEAVINLQFPSIIAWHESQPETKKHLEVGFNIITVFSLR